MDPRLLPPPPHPCQAPDEHHPDRLRRVLDLIAELQSVDDAWPLTELPVGLVCADFLRALDWPGACITAVLGFDVSRWAEDETATPLTRARHD